MSTETELHDQLAEEAFGVIVACQQQGVTDPNIVAHAVVRNQLANAHPAIDVVHLAHQAKWSAATFGPGSRGGGVTDHIIKELKTEVREGQPDEDPSEWIDVIILAFDGAWRSGLSPQQILAGIKAKQAKNEAREWPDWRTAQPGKAIEHVRTAEAAS